jgi:O-succinylbenzoic acid--CoA ligase
MRLRSRNIPEGIPYPNHSNEEVSCSLIKTAISILDDYAAQGKLVVTTSGSSGKPKSYTWSKDLVEWSVKSTQKALNLKEEERAVCCLSLTKTGGLMVLLRGYLLNWDVLLLEPVSNPLLNFPFQKPYHFISLVPLQCSKILEDPSSAAVLNSFDHVLLGGAKMSKALSREIRSSLQNGVQVWQGYGMTETASHVALRSAQDSLRLNEFNILPEVQIAADENQHVSILLPPFEFWLKTNDLGKVDADIFTFLGRQDDVVNSGGVKLNMLDIEQKLENSERLPAHSFFLYKEADPYLGEKLILVCDSGVEVSEQVLENIRPGLEKYEVPRAVYQCNEFEYLISGKIDKQGSLNKARLVEVRS